MNCIDVFTISDFFLSKDNLSPKKLQKLVYYSYAWFVALNNEFEDEIVNVLFDETPEAWLHGPVFPCLYQKYKTYGWKEIEKKENYVCNLNKDLNVFLNDIWEKFGVYSADQLESMTHRESPWINARQKVTVPGENYCLDLLDIFRFYNSL